jgi:hypothetical protein
MSGSNVQGEQGKSGKMTTMERMAFISRVIKDIQYLQGDIEEGLYAWYFETAVNNLNAVKDMIVRDSNV